MQRTWNVATRITHASLTHRQAPYARLPEEWSLPKGVPVVGAGTARHVSHPWSRVVARVWRDTRVAAAASRLNSRPAARLRTSDAHEAGHPFALFLASSSSCFSSPFFSIVSHPVASETEPEGLLRPVRRSSLPHSGPHRSFLFDVPWRGREGDETPSSRGTTRHSRRRSLSRPVGRLAGWLTSWLVDWLARRVRVALLWVTLTHLDLLRARWLRQDQGAWC